MWTVWHVSGEPTDTPAAEAATAGTTAGPSVRAATASTERRWRPGRRAVAVALVRSRRGIEIGSVGSGPRRDGLGDHRGGVDGGRRVGLHADVVEVARRGPGAPAGRGAARPEADRSQ